jgi:hypothetical protein
MVVARRWNLISRLLAVVLVLVEFGVYQTTVSAAPTTYYANKTSDDTGADPTDCADVANVDCSLRAAIALANANPGSTVNVIPGTFTLDHADESDPQSGLIVSASMTISGVGSGDTIIQANAEPNTATYRVMVITGSNVTISGVTIQNGVTTSTTIHDGGAGIKTWGTGILIEDSTIANNSVTVTDTHAEGGGIFIATGDVTLRRSTVRNNTASAHAVDGGDDGVFAYGGGVGLSGDSLTVENSSIIYNTATASRSSNESYINTSGGAIYSQGTQVVVTNSTLAGNSVDGTSSQGAGGALTIINQGIATITNSTIASNTVKGAVSGAGAILSDNASVTMTNDIVVNSPNRTLYVLDDGTISGTYNVVDDATISVITGEHNIHANALVGPLGDYGGPTQTMPLLPGSPAINAGDNVTCATTGDGGVKNLDQRGRHRPSDSCDIGAFEIQGFTISTTSGFEQSTTVGTAFANPLVVTLTENGGNALPGATVTFTPSTIYDEDNGQSATFSTPSVTNANGQASATATANDTPGHYIVIAGVGDGTISFISVNFGLTNTPLPDVTPPVTTATATIGGSTTYTFGSWTNKSVSVSLSADDTTTATNDIDSGVAHIFYTLDGDDEQTYNAAFTISTDGDHTLTYHSVDVANNSESATTVHIKVDRTPPAITYSGNEGSYTIDQTVNITCLAVDDGGSSLDTNTCADINGSALSFGPGAHTFSADASDLAGNATTVSTTFTVGVTVDDLIDLTTQYAATSQAARLLTAPLRLVTLAERIHNPRLKAIAVNTYILWLNIQRGHGLTAQQIDTLTQLARAL